MLASYQFQTRTIHPAEHPHRLHGFSGRCYCVVSQSCIEIGIDRETFFSLRSDLSLMKIVFTPTTTIMNKQIMNIKLVLS